jgi:hypothetical protein
MNRSQFNYHDFNLSFPITGLLSKRSPSQLHNSEVVPRADQSLPENPAEQTSRARLEDDSTRKWSRETQSHCFTSNTYDIF